MDLKTQVLVTGASRGIGLAVSRAFAVAGARVWVCARPSSALDDAVASLSGLGGKARPLPGDLTGEGMDALLEPVSRQGRLDVLVHNVGDVGPFAPFMEGGDRVWRDSLEINLMAAVRLTRLALPLLRASAGGRILFIGSTGARRPTGRWPHYSAAKAALLNFSQSLAVELAPEGITVNTVSPGPVWTQSWEREAAELAARESIPVAGVRQRLRNGAAARVPLGRIGEPEDVAGICLFLASPAASWITGADIPVDGGLGLASP
ncbi:MAG: SDR family oxidoreductase [Nitrospirota bacterium]|nr:SDR family oxidoreductase [Nitrospirota bacterium]